MEFIKLAQMMLYRLLVVHKQYVIHVQKSGRVQFSRTLFHPIMITIL